MLTFEGARGHFPGYARHNAQDASGEWIHASSWVVPLFDYIDQKPLLRLWGDGGIPDADLLDPTLDPMNGTPYLPILACPSDAPASTDTPHLSYIVNCGTLDDPSPAAGESPDSPRNGVFHNHLDGVSRVVRIGLGYLTSHDGSSTTLILSENVIPDDGDNIKWTEYSETEVGFLWLPDGSGGLLEEMEINYDIDNHHPRPASRHGSMVITSFGDGHQQNLNAGISRIVLAKLMTAAGDEVVNEDELQ